MLKIASISLQIGGSAILKEVALSIDAGEMVGLIGPNGSGKTSLFNCISGFAVPQRGSIFFNGIDITNAPPAARAAHGIGRVFQNFGIFREMSLLENMLTALESRDRTAASLWPWSKTTRTHREEALQFLENINLQHRASDRASSLSGGQMRLLEISRTLAFGASLILLDEPTAGVSPKMKQDVAEIILRLRSLKKTVLVIEHDINFIQSFCNRIVVLDVGKIIMDGSPEEIRSDKRLQEIYFGT
ncbi:MAG: ABC transporter ATP-binding protein [Deltaproteobacteria bacterium]|nr:ABC transporter ATP-binding protein [Deltaproteobacteria bacterium]